MKKEFESSITVWDDEDLIRISFTIPREDFRLFYEKVMEKTLTLDMDLPPQVLPAPEPQKPLKIGPVMQAIIEECKLDAKALRAKEWKCWRGIVAMAGGKDDEQTAREVHIRSNVYRTRYPSCPLTITALHKHWAGLIFINER